VVVDGRVHSVFEGFDESRDAFVEAEDQGETNQDTADLFHHYLVSGFIFPLIYSKNH
jgi:hypothetical protein